MIKLRITDQYHKAFKNQIKISVCWSSGDVDFTEWLDYYFDEAEIDRAERFATLIQAAIDTKRSEDYYLKLPYIDEFFAVRDQVTEKILGYSWPNDVVVADYDEQYYPAGVVNYHITFVKFHLEHNVEVSRGN